jgi:Cation/multidrug efflux pump
MTILVSMVVSLTLTPMMASRFLRAHHETRHGRFYQWSERAFDAMLHGYERGLDLALRWRFATLMVFFATLGLSVYLFVIIPKGFFPQQDTGLITATSEAGQDISFAAMKQRQEALEAIVRADPDVASVAMAIGGSGRAGNNGNLFITLKPRDQRKAPPSRSSPACARSSKRSRGAPLHAGGAGRAARRPADADAVRVHAAGCQLGRAERMGAEDPGQMRTLPELRDVATDQQSQGTTLELKINRDTASRYGIQPQ